MKIILAVFVMLSFLGFYANPMVEATDNPISVENHSAYTKITPEQAKAIMDDETSNCIIIDVRSLDEYNSGHIPNAVSLPNETITSDNPQVTAILPDKDQTILVYCRSGKRSKQASDKLVALGYTNICDIGGIMNWPYEVVK